MKRLFASTSDPASSTGSATPPTAATTGSTTGSIQQQQQQQLQGKQTTTATSANDPNKELSWFQRTYNTIKKELKHYKEGSKQLGRNIAACFRLIREKSKQHGFISC